MAMFVNLILFLVNENQCETYSLLVLNWTNHTHTHESQTENKPIHRICQPKFQSGSSSFTEISAFLWGVTMPYYWECVTSQVTSDSLDMLDGITESLFSTTKWE